MTMTTESTNDAMTTWVDVREPNTNRLLFKYDPDRRLVQSICNYWDGEKRERVRFPVITDLTLIQHRSIAPIVLITPAPDDAV